MTSVFITTHAYAQAKTRDRELAASTMRREVADADEAGRKSKAKPRWASYASRGAGGSARAGTWRYFWNEEKTRCYLAVKGDGEWRVVTVLLPT